MIDLGYVRLELAEDWIARLEPPFEQIHFYSMRFPARGIMTLFSVGYKEKVYDVCDELYQALANDVQAKGLHFDDLAEDCENEMVVERVSDNFDSEWQHLFVRACGDVITIFELIDYFTDDEEAVRKMLSTLSPGYPAPKEERLKKVGVPADLEGWSQLGEVKIASTGA